MDSDPMIGPDEAGPHARERRLNTPECKLIARRHWLSSLAMLVSWAPLSAQQSIEQRVDSLFNRYVKPDGPGCALGVYRDGEVVLARGYGLASVEDGRPITPRTTFNLGSVSKPFTALAVLMLEQQGKLSLNDDVRRWVPEMRDYYGTPIRLRDLMQHTSGLRDYGTLGVLSGNEVTTMAEFLGLISAQRALNFVPGTRHEYSHSDYLLLGLIVERVVGVPFGEHLEREVLGPMGMKGSFVSDARPHAITERALGHFLAGKSARVQFPSSQTIGGDNLYASVEDFARWDRNFTSPTVGGPAVIARMLGRPQLANGDTIPYAYGLRLDMYRGLRTIERGGHADGTRTIIVRFRDQGFTVAALCNADHLEPAKLAQRVADIYLSDRMSPARPQPATPIAVTVPAAEIARYAGLYRPVGQPWNVLPIIVRNGALGELIFHDATDDSLFTMTPAGDGRFFEIGSTGNVAVFTFRSPRAGASPRLEISWNGEPPETLERVADAAVWRPSAAALRKYAGTWFSHDLDQTWQLELRGESLVMRRRGQNDLTLRPVERDLFVRGFGPFGEHAAQLQFHRDGAGKLTHFTVSTPPGEDSVRGLRFIRVAVR